MGMVTDIERLGEDIITSHDRRIKSIRELIGDSHKMLEKFQKDRMTDFNAMMDNIKRLMKEIQETPDKRNKEVHNLLNEFKAEREKIASEIAKMAINWHKISETMHRRRVGKISKSTGEPTKTLKEFGESARSRGKEKR